MTESNQSQMDQIIKIDIKNEKIAIGHMLQDEQAAINGSKMLKESHFVTPYASFILKIVKSCIAQAQTVSDIHLKITSITEEDWKKLAPDLNKTREEYVTDCLTLAVAFLGTNIVAEAVFKKVQNQYLRREMYATYQKAITDVLITTTPKDLQEIVHDINTKTNQIIDDVVAEETLSYKESGLKILNKKNQTTISTGFNKLDEIIDGLKPGQLVTIGAGTGIGKSAFAVNLALNVTKQGHKVGLWSFEMDIEEIFQRILSNKSGFAKKGENAEERFNACRKYLDNTKDDIGLYTTPIKDLGRFYLQCRQLSMQDGMKVIIIDYLQLIHLKNEHPTSRVGEIELITNTLKLMASELGITVIVLSQLSRAHQKRDDKTPILSDLRDSGSIEQDSNVVIFLHKPEEQPGHFERYESIIKVIVAKNRSGRSGSFFLKYNGALTKFIEKQADNQR